MIIGIPPFFNKNKHQMYELIQHAPLKWPDQARHGFSVSPEAKDLLSKLLEKDRRKRIGKEGDVQEILSHPFFADIDIEKLSKKEIEPPFKPQVITDEELIEMTTVFTKAGGL